MIKLIYLEALSHRAIYNAAQVENHFTVVASDVYAIHDHSEYTGTVFVTDFIYL